MACRAEKFSLPFSFPFLLLLTDLIPIGGPIDWLMIDCTRRSSKTFFFFSSFFLINRQAGSLQTCLPIKPSRVLAPRLTTYPVVARLDRIG